MKSAGIFVDAGTKANLYGYTLGVRKNFQDVLQKGIMKLGKNVLFINSQAGHFSNLTNLALIGVGIDNAIPIPVDAHGSIDLEKLEKTIVSLHRKNIVIPAILLTVGTTDTFGTDDVKKVFDLRKKICRNSRYKPHIHADAAIGWAMALFNDYDFDENIHGFDDRTLSRLRKKQHLFQNLRYADSITLDFHKTGYTPYAASMILIKNRRDLQPFKWKPGMFKYFNPEEIEIAPVQYTLECTRSPEAVFSISGNLLAFGIEGYQLCLGWAIQVSNYLRERLKETGHVGIINYEENGLSTVFRVYPKGVAGESELRKELYDPKYSKNLQKNSKFSKGIFEYRNKRLTPKDPKLDYTSAGIWALYTIKHLYPDGKPIF